MYKQLLIILVCLLTASCSASLPTLTPGRNIPVYNGSHPVPSDLNAEVIDKVNVVHGHGCGGFGAVGSIEGVHILLRNQAMVRKADAVNVIRYVPPHMEMRGSLGCHVNDYWAEGELLRIPRFSYTPPTVQDNKSENKKLSYVIPAGFDETWSALINAVSSDFFELQNYEKDSGLLTLSFDPDGPAEYVNCGYWTKESTDHYEDFSGPYVEWLKQSEQKNARQGNGRFAMKMKINLRVHAISATNTQVEVNTLYRVAANSTNMDFKFKSGAVSTVQAAISPKGMDTIRKCQSTYKLEDHLLNTIKKIANNT